jgi:ABC-type phosphate transport system substrate-binding protein
MGCAQSYTMQNVGATVTVTSGGSGWGADSVCSHYAHIGDMSRNWKPEELNEAPGSNANGQYTCVQTEALDQITISGGNSAPVPGADSTDGTGPSIIQAVVGYDGLSVAVAKGGVAEACVGVDGLSLAQLRWMYTSLSDADLAAAWGANSVADVIAGDNGNGVKEWTDLCPDLTCTGAECVIVLAGADSVSGTFEYLGESIFPDFAGCGSSENFPFGDDSCSQCTLADGACTYYNSADDDDVVDVIKQFTNAIGFFGYAYVQDNADTLSAVPVSPNDAGVAKNDAVVPASATIDDDSYPLARPLFLNVLNEPGALAAASDFISYMANDVNGCVSQEGYVPVSASDADKVATSVNSKDSGSAQASLFMVGSSTVYPLALTCGAAFTKANANYQLTVASGGSGAGAAAVCSHQAHIGDMSRDWKSSEVTPLLSDGYTYTCNSVDPVQIDQWTWSGGRASNNGVAPVDDAGTMTAPAWGATITQTRVAFDGLSVVVGSGGVADSCVGLQGSLQGLTFAQLRWIYSDLDTDALVASMGVSSIKDIIPNDDGDNVKEWTDLCADAQCTGADCNIIIAGADVVSGTFEYMGETIFPDFAGGCAGPENFMGLIANGCAECTVDDSVKDGSECTYFNSARDEDIAAVLTKYGNAIGYFGYAYLQEEKGLGVSSVRVSDCVDAPISAQCVGVEPTLSTIEFSEYPISRALYMNVLNEPGAWSAVAPFLQYVLNSNDCVLASGYVPLSDTEKAAELAKFPGAN